MNAKICMTALLAFCCGACSHQPVASSQDRIKIVVLGTNAPKSVYLNRYSVKNVWSIVQLGGGLRGAEDQSDQYVSNVKLRRSNGDHITIRRTEWNRPLPKVIQPLRNGDVFVFPEVSW